MPPAKRDEEDSEEEAFSLPEDATLGGGGSSQDLTKMRRRNVDYSVFIYRTLKQMRSRLWPATGITKTSIFTMNSLINDVFDRIAEEAGKVASRNGQAILSVSEIQTSVLLVLPEELAKHAVSAGSKAVAEFGSDGQSSSAKSAGGRATEQRNASTTAGLQFSVARVRRALKTGGYAERAGARAGVYLAAVLEFLCGKTLGLAGDIARNRNTARIVANYIVQAVEDDVELRTFITVKSSGILPNIHAILQELEATRDCSERPVLCEDCPCSPTINEDTGETEKCAMCDGWFADDGMNDILFLPMNDPHDETEWSCCSICNQGGTKDSAWRKLCIMKGSGQVLCVKGCDESDAEDEEDDESWYPEYKQAVRDHNNRSRWAVLASLQRLRTTLLCDGGKKWKQKDAEEEVEEEVWETESEEEESDSGEEEEDEEEEEEGEKAERAPKSEKRKNRLQGVLAFEMITSDDLWREILGFL